MYRIINSICHKISPVLFCYFNSKVKNNFIATTSVILPEKKEQLFSTNDIISSLIYKDESWNSIKFIGHHMWNDLFKYNFLKISNPNYFTDNSCVNSKVVFENNAVICKSHNKPNDWIFLEFPKKIEQSYLIEFDSILFTEFTEFQFAFNFNSIGERYRFNLVNNKNLNFDLVHKGFFHNHLATVPLILEKGRFYNIKIYVMENNFSYLVNDIVILSVNQKKKMIDFGQFAFILWDKNNLEIDMIYKNLNLYKI